jgi:hypothetical protein
MIEGYGDVYRQGLADWNAIIDGRSSRPSMACWRCLIWGAQ